MIPLLIALAVPAQLAAALPQDSIDRLRSQARSAEARFERLSRNMAPTSWGGFDGRNCDEIVGRFCLRFDSTSVRPAIEEDGRVVDERRAAVEAVRLYFSAAPGELTAAGPLARLLVLDDRSAEAVSAARAFAALTTDTLWGHLLLGFAHNANAELVDAEREFVRAFERMDDDMRRAWTDPQWLIDGGELRRLRRLPTQERAEYERRFWIVSDPLWLTDANERWIEHMSRHVEAELMGRVPVVAGMLRWGADLDELTVRYGTPSARAKIRGNQPWDNPSFVEYFDTAQRAYSPERWLETGMSAPPRPGDPPALYAAKARAGHALRTVHRLVELPHQVTRFLAGDTVVLRIDAGAPRPEEPHTPAPGARPLVGLFAYDSAFTRRVQDVRPGPAWPDDTLRFSLSVRAPPDQLIYSVEVLDTAASFAARARYAVDAFVPGDGPVVSDLLLCAPFDGRLPDRRDDPALRALHSQVLERGATIGVYAEVYRLAGTGPEALRLEFSLDPADGPGLLTRLGRWIGRATGIVRPQTDPRVAWHEEVDAGVHSVAVNLPLDPRRTGRYVLSLRVTDPGTGLHAVAQRELLIR
jgi:hypothetical protein